MITVRPNGGIGNRMRVIDSGIALKRCTDKKLKVIWNINPELKCSFYSLFEEPGFFKVEEIHTTYLEQKIYDKTSTALNYFRIKYPFSFEKVLVDREIEKLKTLNYDFCDYRKFNTIYIYSNRRFLFPDNPHNYLKPKKEILLKANQLLSEINEHTIGIHIRRSDNVQSAKKSPLYKFVELIEFEKNINPEVNFFLSTDSPDVEQIIKHKFPDRIICFEKELRRDKENGVQDALVDMICLSKTKKIIGSYWSSFSEVASEIGNIPLIIALA